MPGIDELVAQMNKKYKTNIIRKASELKGIEFIPYSSPKMNYLTRGGVPVGRMIEFVGLPQSGKTTTALDVLANYQKMAERGEKCRYSVYLDAENAMDKDWGNTLGVDWDKVILIQPESEYGEQLLDMLLDYIRSGEIGFVVVDSAPVIQPKTTCDNALEDKSYGGNSALMKAFVDKAVPLCKKHECTFIMVNQIRENIGNMYKPYKIPCGTALTHACSEILWFTKGSLLDEQGNEKSGNYANPVGNVVNVKIEKNKVTKNDRRLDSYTLNYSLGVEDVTDTIDLGIKLGVIVQSGAWFVVPTAKGKEKKLHGRPGVLDWFYNDMDEFDWFKNEVNEAAK